MGWSAAPRSRHRLAVSFHIPMCWRHSGARRPFPEIADSTWKTRPSHCSTRQGISAWGAGFRDLASPRAGLSVAACRRARYAVRRHRARAMAAQPLRHSPWLWPSLQLSSRWRGAFTLSQLSTTGARLLDQGAFSARSRFHPGSAQSPPTQETTQLRAYPEPPSWPKEEGQFA